VGAGHRPLRVSQASGEPSVQEPEQAAGWNERHVSVPALQCDLCCIPQAHSWHSLASPSPPPVLAGSWSGWGTVVTPAAWLLRGRARPEALVTVCLKARDGLRVWAHRGTTEMLWQEGLAPRKGSRPVTSVFQASRACQQALLSQQCRARVAGEVNTWEQPGWSND